MKILYNILALILFTFLLSCKKDRSITENSTAIKILALDESGKIKESAHKNKFKLVFYPLIINGFIKDEFGYRIKENSELWRVYEDSDYQIIVGTIAKNEYELYMFTMVYKKTANNWEIVTLQIGQKKNGNYPYNIIPYKLH